MEEVHLTATFSISPQSTYKSQMIGGYVRVQSLNIKHQLLFKQVFSTCVNNIINIFAMTSIVRVMVKILYIFTMRLYKFWQNSKHFEDGNDYENYGKSPKHYVTMTLTLKILFFLTMIKNVKLRQKCQNF